MTSNPISLKINRESSSPPSAHPVSRRSSFPSVPIPPSAPVPPFSVDNSVSLPSKFVNLVALTRENSFQRYPNVSKDDLEQIIEDIIDDKNLSINNLTKKLFVALADNDEEHFLRSFLQSQNQDTGSLNSQVLKDDFNLLDSALQAYMKDKNQEPIDNSIRIGVWIGFLGDQEKLKPYQRVQSSSSSLMPISKTNPLSEEHPVEVSSIVAEQIERRRQSLLAQVLFGNLGEGLSAEEQVAVCQKVQNGQSQSVGESTQVAAAASQIQGLAVMQVKQDYQQRGMTLNIPEQPVEYQILTNSPVHQSPDLLTNPFLTPPPLTPPPLTPPPLTPSLKFTFRNQIHDLPSRVGGNVNNFTTPLNMVFGVNGADYLSLNSNFYEQIDVQHTLPDFISGLVANSVYGAHSKNDDRAVLLTGQNEMFISAIDGMGGGSNSEYVANLLAEEMKSNQGNIDQALLAVDQTLNNRDDLGPNDGALFAAAKIYKNLDGDIMLSATSIGDSQVMVFDRDGELRFESNMHNNVLQSEKEGKSSKKDAMRSPMRAFVSVAVTKNNPGIKDCFRQDILLLSGDIVLVMTDGVTDNLHRDEIQGIVRGHIGNIKEIFTTIGTLVEEQMKSANNPPSIDIWNEETEAFPNGRTLLPKADNVTLLAIQCA
jgi:serine/threonine protein phosphatase PrpC